MDLKQRIADKNIYGLWLLILAGAIFFLINDFHSDFWFDEAYSLRMTQHSFSDIWRIAGLDVHPPLYYYMLKAYSLIAGDSVVGFRIFSTIGVVATMILGGLSIRRLFGAKAAFIFLSLMIFTPINQYLSGEIRMYSWAMFFCLGGGIFAYRAFAESKKSNWILLTFFTTTSFYTHYYGAITMIGIYAILLLLSLKHKKSNIKYIVYCTLAVTILYAPWLANMLYQVTEVTGEYWILPIQLSDVFFYLTVPFDLKAAWPHNPKTITVTAFILMLITAIFVAAYFETRKQEDKKKKFELALLFLSAYLLVMLAGIILSLSIRPVFISRYMICPLGLFIASLAICISLLDLKKKLNAILVRLFLLVLALASAYRFYSTVEVNKFNETMQASIQHYLKQNMGKDDAFLAPPRGHFALGPYSVLYPEHAYYYYTNSYGKFMDNFSFQFIKNLNEIDPKHPNIFIINSDPGSDFMYDMDSTEVAKYFIVEKYVTSSKNALYKLKAKNNAE